jgi:glycosyltransferase involved in cell wall biosynthesis
VRVAFCITELDPGGAEQALVQVVRRLDRGRFEPMVFCLAGRGALVEPLESAGVPVECLGARHTRQVSVAWRLVRGLRRFRPDIVQTWLYHANILGRVAAKAVGVRRVVSGIRVAERRGRLRLRVDQWTDWLVDRHVCVSQVVADFSAEAGRLPRRKLLVIPNGVEFERFATGPTADLSGIGIPAEAPVVLFVGRLDPQKDPLTLVEAFRQVAAERRDVHLLLAGSGPLEQPIRDVVRASGLASRIHLAGRIEDIAPVMRAASLLVLPSLWEGMPNVVLEAMAAALPVVASDVEGVREALQGGSLGLLCRPGDAEAFADLINQVLSDTAGRSQVAACAQAYVHQEFTWEAVVERYERLYAELIHDG